MSEYNNHGQFVVNKMSLFYTLGSAKEQEVDLSSAFVQMDLYESVFENTMSGSISILDSFNMQDLLPLYGNERIELDFNAGGQDDTPIQYTGVVYKVSEKHRISEHTTGYTLYFVSKEAINNQRLDVQRGYEDTPSSIVTELYKEIAKPIPQDNDLKYGPDYKYDKPIVVSDTMSIEHYVFGTIKPLQAISVLSKHAYSAKKEYGYVFYEDNKQFNFVPLHML